MPSSLSEQAQPAAAQHVSTRPDERQAQQPKRPHACQLRVVDDRRACDRSAANLVPFGVSGNGRSPRCLRVFRRRRVKLARRGALTRRLDPLVRKHLHDGGGDLRYEMLGGSDAGPRDIERQPRHLRHRYHRQLDGPLLRQRKRAGRPHPQPLPPLTPPSRPTSRRTWPRERSLLTRPPVFTHLPFSFLITMQCERMHLPQEVASASMHTLFFSNPNVFLQRSRYNEPRSRLAETKNLQHDKTLYLHWQPHKKKQHAVQT